jgi:anti-anti-sigma factor
MSPPGRMHTLVLIGELDRSSAHTLEAAIERLEGGTSAITLDLSNLTHIDSTGVAVIAFRSRLCQRRGYDFALIRGPWFVQREFELAGLGDRLPFEGDMPSGVPAALPAGPVPDAPSSAELPTERRTRSRANRRAISLAPRRSFALPRIWQGQRGSARP